MTSQARDGARSKQQEGEAKTKVEQKNTENEDSGEDKSGVSNTRNNKISVGRMIESQLKGNAGEREA